MHGKIGGFVISLPNITLPNIGTLRHRNTDNQDNLLKRIVLRICQHPRNASLMPTIRSTMRRIRNQIELDRQAAFPSMTAERLRIGGERPQEALELFAAGRLFVILAAKRRRHKAWKSYECFSS
jgi:hypothetical protein